MNQTVQAMDPATFGAWGQWAGAGVTFLAVVVALWVAISDRRSRTRDMLEQRAAQARTITAHVELIPDPYPGSSTTLQQQVVTVQNHGTLPITNVTLDSIFARDTAANPVTRMDTREYLQESLNVSIVPRTRPRPV